MKKNHRKLLCELKEKGRFLTEEEIIDFYVENVQRNECRLNMWAQEGQGRRESYSLADLNCMSKSFYFRALGVLCSSGHLWFLEQGKGVVA